jgi:RND family efflux transporter MFP subunit
MKNIFNFIKGFIRNHKIWSSIIGLVILGIIWYAVAPGKNNTGSTFVLVEKGTITEEVSVTGNVKPFSAVDLAFERGGRLANIAVEVGDTVYTGQTLAGVSSADLVANLDRAKADLRIAELQFGKIKINASTTELLVENQGVAKAVLDLAQAKISLVNEIKDSFTKADDAVRNKIFSLFTDPVRYRAKLSFNTGYFLQEDIEEGKDEVNDILDSWYRILSKSDIAQDVETNYNLAKKNLTIIKKLLDKCAEAVNGLILEDSYTTQTQIDIWKSNISIARTNINLAISSLTDTYDRYQALILAFNIAESNFSVQEINVDQAKANVASAEAELAKTIIKSPITGVITKIDTKLGEIISANIPIISVISYGDYEIESYIPEADIAKVKMGNIARTTLDAYGDNIIFETTVIKIDPAATVIDGVPTYKVTLKFTTKDERVRSGMTANLDILTNQKDDVLVLPNRVIITKEDGKYVLVMDITGKGEVLEKKIVTGLRGSNGTVEIISGINEGDKVLTP